MFFPYGGFPPFNMQDFYSGGQSNSFMNPWQEFFKFSESYYKSCMCMKSDFQELFKQYALNQAEHMKKMHEMNQKFYDSYMELVKKNCVCEKKDS